MGNEHARQSTLSGRRRPPVPGAARVGAPIRAPTLVDAVIELQRTAGNLAVAGELAMQRDEAAAPKATMLEGAEYVKALAELWDNSVMQRLVEAKDKLTSDPKTAYIVLSHALEFVERAMDAVPRDHLTWIKLRILGRSIDGIKAVLADRMKLRGGATNVVDDLRSWYREASDLGPSLKAAPGGRTVGADEKTSLWNEGVVFPIGRAILKAADDPRTAMSELSDSLEILHMWREAAPRGVDKLRLIDLERGALYSLKRLEQRVGGPGEVDLAADLTTTLEEAAVIGQVLATTPPKPAPPPSATPSNKPFVNDTELMRPGD
jgi:hypothetical protein